MSLSAGSVHIRDEDREVLQGCIPVLVDQGGIGVAGLDRPCRRSR